MLQSFVGSPCVVQVQELIRRFFKSPAVDKESAVVARHAKLTTPLIAATIITGFILFCFLPTLKNIHVESPNFYRRGAVVK